MLSRHSCADKILSHRLLGIVLSQVPELLALTGLFFREGVLPMSWKRKDSSSISQVRNYYQFLSPGSCLCVMFGHVVNMCVAFQNMRILVPAGAARWMEQEQEFVICVRHGLTTTLSHLPLFLC